MFPAASAATRQWRWASWLDTNVAPRQFLRSCHTVRVLRELREYVLRWARPPVEAHAVGDLEVRFVELQASSTTFPGHGA